MDDFEVDDLSPERLPSAIYNCVSCAKKVAHGDRFCRHCGIKFTAAQCAKMQDNLKIIAKDNFWHLVVIMLVTLAIILSLVFI